jgi:hypothetical protein
MDADWWRGAVVALRFALALRVPDESPPLVAGVQLRKALKVAGAPPIASTSRLALMWSIAPVHESASLRGKLIDFRWVCVHDSNAVNDTSIPSHKESGTCGLCMLGTDLICRYRPEILGYWNSVTVPASRMRA